MTKRHMDLHRWPTLPSRDVDHLCVDNVRYWSMFAIVAVHSLLAWGIHADSRIGWELQIALLQAMKFGTIGFYLISGFLLGPRVDRRPPYDYLLRRLKTVAFPWVIWAAIFTVLPFVKVLLLGGGTGNVGASMLRYASNVLLFSPYWFVPNFFIALTTLLLLRRYLDNVRIGIGLFAISLFYAVNIYGKWIPASHTYAAFGFVFYLWLGSWASRHWSALTRLLNRIGSRSLLLGILVAAALSFGEAHVLNSLKAENVVNTLRLSNQVFSVLAVLGLMKLRRPTWPAFIDVRAHTFGLYLVHPVCIFLLARAVDTVFRFAIKAVYGARLESYGPVWVHPMTAVLLWASMFAFCYSLSLWVVKGISQSELRWAVGRTSTRVEAPQARPAPPVHIELKPAA